MATRWAVATGNWSNPETWDGGTLPGAGDDVYADGKTVTIDQTATVLTIRTTQRSGGTVGGGFVLNAGVTFTATNPLASGGGIIPGVTGAMLTYSAASGTATVICNLISTAGRAMDKTSTATLLLVGNILGGAGGAGLTISGAGPVTITGAVEGGNNTASYGINITAAATVTITGAVRAGSQNIAHGLNITAAATVTITGAVSAGGGIGVNAGILAITLDVIGTMTASAGNNALYSTSAGAINRCSGPFVNNSNGKMAILAANLYLTTAVTQWEMWTYNLFPRVLYTSDSIGGNPAAANVRLGTTFGPTNELTGLCAVPPAASVSYGVPVDQTTGTATVTAADIRAALGLSAANLDTQLSGLPASIWGYTTRTLTEGGGITAQQVWEYATRTITSGGVTAQQVWEYATRTLTADSGITAQQVWEYATRTLTAGSGVSAQEIWEYVSTALPDTAEGTLSSIEARMAEQAPGAGPVLVIPAPSGPTMTTAYIYCYDEHGVLEPGVTIQIRLRSLGTGLEGSAFETARIEAVSNSDGLATAEIPRGASLQFQARRGTTGAWTVFSGANTETLELPALLGNG